MRRVLLLVRKDLLRRRRAPLGVLIMIAFPLLFAGMMGLVFAGGGSGLPRVRLLLENRDEGLAGGLLRGALTADEMAEHLDVVEVGEDGRQRMEDGEASALLIIPEDTSSRLLDGAPVTFELVRNPSQGILPEIAEQISGVLADGLSVAARLLHQQTGDWGVTDLESVGDLTDADFMRLALAARHTFEGVADFINEPPLELEVVSLEEEPAAEDSEDDEEESSNRIPIFLFILPGISVYALFIIGDQMMRDLLTEMQLGTLKRQLSAPLGTTELLAAKVLTTGVVAGAALLVLAAIAAAVVEQPVNLIAFAALASALVLAVTGAASALYGVAKNERQGSTLTALVYLVLAFSGGSFIPVDQLPAAMRAISPASPFYWGTRGFQDLLRGAGLAEIAAPAAMLAAVGLALLTAGSLLLRRRLLAGDAA